MSGISACGLTFNEKRSRSSVDECEECRDQLIDPTNGLNMIN